MTIQSKPASVEYLNNFDRIFRKGNPSKEEWYKRILKEQDELAKQAWKDMTGQQL